MARTMTPLQSARDLLDAIPRVIPCCSGMQSVSVAALESLRDSMQNACDEEGCVHRILARCRVLAYQEVIRCRVQADADAALRGKPHPRSEEALAQAQELLASLDARLGVNDD